MIEHIDAKSGFEKKSERIENRVSHRKKQAFNEACDTQGDTPSSALRRFIDGYIRRADQDIFKDGMRAMFRGARRQWVPLTMSAAVLASLLLIGGYYSGKALRGPVQDGPIVTASTEEFPPINYSLFAAYDKNANGVLDLGEVAENDEHLHRVLNLDGEAGISPAEFYEVGDMDWTFIQKGSVQLGETAFMEEDEPIPSVRTKQIDGEVTKIVIFDLSDPLAPSIQISPLNGGEPVKRENLPESIRRLVPKNPKSLKVTTRRPTDL